MPERRVALACGLVAVAVSGVAVVAAMSAQSWSVTALVRTAPDDPIAPITRAVDPGFQFVAPGGHYDGSFFYAVAIDPLALGEAHDLIDRPAYRYAHPGYGWAAWALSIGRPRLVPAALFLIGIVSMAVAAASASLIARRFGWSAWWGGLLIALNPGLIFSVTADTSEPIGLALAGLLVLAWLERRWVVVGALSIVLSLTKEPMMIVPVGLAVWELVKARRGEPSPDIKARVAAVGAGLVAFLVWNVYLRTRFGVWPSSEGADLLSLPPFAGWVDTLGRAADYARNGSNSMQIGTFTLSVLPAIAAALLVGFVKALKLRTFFDFMFICFALIVFSLNWLQLLNPKDMIREVAIAFAFLPAVLITARPPPGEALDQPA